MAMFVILNKKYNNVLKKTTKQYHKWTHTYILFNQLVVLKMKVEYMIKYIIFDDDMTLIVVELLLHFVRNLF